MHEHSSTDRRRRRRRPLRGTLLPALLAVLGWAVLAGTAAAQGTAGAAGDAAPAGEAARDREPAAEDRRIEELERRVRQLEELLRAAGIVPEAAAGEAEPAAVAAEAEPAAETGAGEPATGEGQPADAVAEAPQPADGEPWEVGYREGGGGFFLRSPDGRFQLRSLGYIQVVGSLFADDFERADAPGDFSIRRARLDWFADFGDRYQLFVEIDGGPGSTPGSSDFALVEGKLTVALAGERLKLVAGKYVTPFSSEDRLSSRSLDTVERYMALNSLFLLPATDVQFGTMLRGKTGVEGRLEWYAGLFNGNGRANDNLSDDNGDKEVQLKALYRVSPELRLGLGLDYSHEEAQSLQLRGLSFTPYTAIPVRGTRRGIGGDFHWERDRLALRGEGLYFEFPDSGAELAGGFVQGAYLVRGSKADGTQALVRLETAGLDSDRLAIPGDRIDGVTLGLNRFWGDGTMRLQLNGIFERYDGPSNLPAGASRVEGEGWKPYLLTELQVKF